MPIIIARDLPAAEILKKESIFALSDQSAQRQDIRPLKIGIVNLMPKKIQTETQLLRLLSMSPLQLDIRLVRMANHKSKNTNENHLKKFYRTPKEMMKENLDGLIITGAPVEQKPFEDVDYWSELVEIMSWSQTHCTSILHICWGAQAGLFHHYGVEKTLYEKKLFGVFSQTILHAHPLLRGFSNPFASPQSRYTGICEEQIPNTPLTVLAKSTETGPNILVSNNRKNIFLLGHFEYDTKTLEEEYLRDQQTGVATEKPQYYYQEDDQHNETIPNTWRSNASLLFMNWVNDVYQRTPFDLTQVGQAEFHHPDEYQLEE